MEVILDQAIVSLELRNSFVKIVRDVGGEDVKRTCQPRFCGRPDRNPSKFHKLVE